jgi:hypothetical protein
MSDDDEIPVRDVPPDDGPENTPPEREAASERDDTPADESGEKRSEAPADDPLAELRAVADGAREFATMVNERFVAPLMESYPQVAEHLTAAGTELAAVFRSILRGQEEEWHAEPDPERITIAPQESTEREPVDDEDSGKDDE